MNRLIASQIALVLALAAAADRAVAQEPLGSGFTYQGQLKLSGEVLSDTADFEFTLWDAGSAGNMIGSVVAVNNVTVVDGLFTVELDFGVLAFNGEARWLEIDVRSPSGGGGFTTLDPRQPLTAIPYSLQTRGMFVDDLGNVGIGTTSPQALFQVRDKPLASGAFNAETTAGALLTSSTDNGGNTPAPRESALILARAGVTSEAFANYARFDLSRYENAGTASRTQLDIRLSHGNLIGEVNDTPIIMSLQSGGNIGIGTDNPQAKLHIAGTPGVDGIMFPDGTLQTSAGGGGGGFWQASGDDIFNTNTGNVGIGTTSPLQALHVLSSGSSAALVDNPSTAKFASGLHGLISSTSPGVFSAAVRGENRGTAGAGIGVWGSQEGSGWGVYGATLSGIAVIGQATGTSGVNYGVLGQTDSPDGYAGYFSGGRNYFQGDVGIGTTTPGARLHVVGFAQNADMMVESANGSTTDRARIILKITDRTWNLEYDGVSNLFKIRDVTGGADRLVIDQVGNVGIGRAPFSRRLEVEGNASKSAGGLWATNSDRRIKKSVETIEGALETLDKVRLVSFEYTDTYRKTHAGVDSRRYLNVIAQEFAEVFPDHVEGSGENLPDGSEILQVDAYPLIIYASAAIQELHAKSREKDAEIADLTNRLERMEAMLKLLIEK